MDSWVDGQLAHALSLKDRGLAYGDGLFETIAVRKGTPI
jgi:4-amino-4-deoxychorismate lyase